MKFMLLLFQILGCGAFIHRASLNSKSFELNLFQNKGSSVKAKGGKSVESEAAIAKFRAARPNADLKDEILTTSFNKLASIFKDDKATTLEIVDKFPEFFLLACREGDSFGSVNSMKKVFDIYESKWGYEKALGVVTRNPPLLAVRPTGYGSAEAAGDDTVAISYLIDATRGKGQYYLAVLGALLLSKAVGFSFFN